MITNGVLVLVVEDEEKLANVVVKYLEANNYKAHWEMFGEKAVEAAQKLSPALIVLDLNLPDIDGLEVCKRIREFSTAPIIMLTARTEEIQKVLGLDAGADDYVTKPFSPGELMARIRAMLRRLQWPEEKPIIPGLVMNAETYKANFDGKNLNLTPVEFRLLATLLQSPGRIYSRSQLLDTIYDDYRDTTDRAIDSHIRNLRGKLRKLSPDDELIRSVYGVGYKIDI
ncbi:response regulator [Parahaliea maris]|uniref:Response regulator n=1 Tax=Parahaliea maris TaxID=2716870 RepID=A0A5C8ZS04_9GAMM|nr:response regulator [Parahaliea maris]TXS90287.1 response regulator [Parahaliea maris]